MDGYVYRHSAWRGQLRKPKITKKTFENVYSPSKHGRTINSTNQDTNTNQIKTKTVTERTENT